MARLRSCTPVLRALATRRLQHLLRPWLDDPDLAWSMHWLEHALNHGPDGQAWTYTTTVRSPAGWLTWRLSHWLDQGGRPLPSPGVAIAARRQVHAASAERARRERAEQARRANEDQAFGTVLGDIAGQAYPTLVRAVMAQESAATFLPAAAADALTRHAVRERIPYTMTNAQTLKSVIADAVREILADTAAGERTVSDTHDPHVTTGNHRSAAPTSAA